MQRLKKLLIIDDEDDVRLFLEDFLSEREFYVSSAPSAEEGLELMAKNIPDVVLLDLMMPGMDGLECLKQIKKKYPQIKVIMITALNDEAKVALAKKNGAENYILKPFSLEYLESELLELIREEDTSSNDKD